jgi:hypothetical protein
MMCTAVFDGVRSSFSKGTLDWPEEEQAEEEQVDVSFGRGGIQISVMRK